MNYIDAIACEIGKCCKMDMTDAEDMKLLRIYALLALTVGKDVTLEHVHDAWAVWTVRMRPAHPSLVPFDQLAPDVQMLDEPHRAAIARVAAEVA